ncbi:hypothetical protein CHARACLAT_019041 [Characodon lateralis]|uniref:Uncharacterized protein n=1 Tax=Characodon lateralis TaxID=208331 RepID=A0ABU7ENX7_9TELE|nr:hypothetical protein [Characodon lateralis]
MKRFESLESIEGTLTPHFLVSRKFPASNKLCISEFPYLRHGQAGRAAALRPDAELTVRCPGPSCSSAAERAPSRRRRRNQEEQQEGGSQERLGQDSRIVLDR